MMRIKQETYRRTFNCKQTRCTITSDSEVAINAAISSIRHNRAQLEEYTLIHPEFLYSLLPIEVSDGPSVVRMMAEASERANVGPMATVAGVLADFAVEAMVSEGAKVAVVEDGGEAYAISERPVDVVLVAGDTQLSRHLGFRLEEFPIGVATSSGVFSHALSFGEAEAVTIFAENAGLADAAATAVCNIIRGDDHRKAIEQGVTRALSIRGVKGVFILYREIVGKAGQFPKIIKIKSQ